MLGDALDQHADLFSLLLSNFLIDWLNLCFINSFPTCLISQCCGRWQFPLVYVKKLEYKKKIKKTLTVLILP